MPNVDFRIARPDDNSDEGILAEVSEPLWSLWAGFGDTEEPESIASFFGQLNEGQGRILAVAICRSEIANGGVDQFFLESTGKIWPQALEGLRIIKAEKYVKLLEKVLALFPNGKAPIQTKGRNDFISSLPDDKTDKLFESVNEKWDELDSSDKQSLAAFCARYICSNPNYFFIE
jgi:Domain of unknown function (DUF4375)